MLDRESKLGHKIATTQTTILATRQRDDGRRAYFPLSGCCTRGLAVLAQLVRSSLSQGYHFLRRIHASPNCDAHLTISNDHRVCSAIDTNIDMQRCRKARENEGSSLSTVNTENSVPLPHQYLMEEIGFSRAICWSDTPRSSTIYIPGDADI
jgi:hypothetical protein